MVPRYLVICYLLIVFCLAAFSKRTAYQSLSIISSSLRYSRLLLRFFRTQDSTTWCNRRDTRDAVQYRRRFYTETTHAKRHQAGRQTEAIGPWAASKVTLFSQKPTAAIVVCVCRFFRASQFFMLVFRFFLLAISISSCDSSVF